MLKGVLLKSLHLYSQYILAKVGHFKSNNLFLLFKIQMFYCNTYKSYSVLSPNNPTYNILLTK